MTGMNRMPNHRAICFATLLACVTVAASAQDRQDLRFDLQQGNERRPLEQGVEDVGPLSTSLRRVERGLDLTSDFSRVYPVPGHPGLLMRTDGGIYAVFRQSVYSEAGAEIPAGTVFYIGEPQLGPVPGQETDPPGDGEGDNDERVLWRTADDLREESESESDPAQTSAERLRNARPSLPSILHDPTYRRARLLSLMRRAARHEVERASGDDG